MNRWRIWSFTAALIAVVAGCGESDKTPGGNAKSPAAKTELVPAVPGVGEKGRGLEDGPVGTPIKTLFRVQEWAALKIQLASAMRLYQAENGHYPGTEKEFMARIIKANSIKLPALPPGSKYVYDAKRAAQMTEYDAENPPLMVKRETD